MEKLKPCPFCGWGTIVDGGFLNHSCTCNSCRASTKPYPTWELAVEAWNRRAYERSKRMEQDKRKNMTGLDLVMWIFEHKALDLEVRVGYITPKGEYTTSVITPGIEELTEPAEGNYIVL